LFRGTTEELIAVEQLTCKASAGNREIPKRLVRKEAAKRRAKWETGKVKEQLPK